MESVSSLTNAINDEVHPQPAGGGPRQVRRRASRTEVCQGRGRRAEHRNGNRHRAMMLVKVHEAKDCCAAGMLYDVSADGMLVLSEMPPGVDKYVDIEFASSPAMGHGDFHQGDRCASPQRQLRFDVLRTR